MIVAKPGMLSSLIFPCIYPLVPRANRAAESLREVPNSEGPINYFGLGVAKPKAIGIAKQPASTVVQTPIDSNRLPT